MREISSVSILLPDVCVFAACVCFLSGEKGVVELVEDQIAGKSVAKAEGVVLNFADGSSATAKTAYLTMLPYDLAALDGFGAWASTFDKVCIPDLAPQPRLPSRPWPQLIPNLN